MTENVECLSLCASGLISGSINPPVLSLMRHGSLYMLICLRRVLAKVSFKSSIDLID